MRFTRLTNVLSARKAPGQINGYVLANVYGVSATFIGTRFLRNLLLFLRIVMKVLSLSGLVLQLLYLYRRLIALRLRPRKGLLVLKVAHLARELVS